MKSISKISVSVILIAIVLVISVAPALAATPSIDYVAFGDSVASGVRGGISEPGSDFGYTDLIAANLKAARALGSFNKDFCVSGITAELLASNTAVLNDTTSSGYKLVKNAEIATLDIGGNDLLAPIYAYVKTLPAGSLPDKAKIKEILTAIGDSVNDGVTAPCIEKNIETILQNILNANPNIKIYVMGYYNPLPVAAAITDVDLDSPLKEFNVYIQKAISDVAAVNSGASITYIDTMTAMAADSSTYLVMTDIHPTVEGYKVIAAEFWKQIGLLVPSTVTATPTKSSVLVNSKTVAFDAYNIGGNNYFKLRDIAMALSGSTKQFGVGWDGKSITLSSGSVYTSVGGELSVSGNTADVSAVKTASSVYLDGKLLSLTAYNINGNNYFKLRDLGSAINFGIGWDSATSTISIDTTQGYAA
ncbi:MAG: hypothetical protein CVU91_00125 [Firmicutes bacterium HGW-Firmicutes-16]|nr:MAG: hypothetical protein CVU91_00125 [Firmicutes bacterium HGW-Firmicutes-16]